MFLEMFLKVRKEKEVVWYACNTIPEKRGKEILLFLQGRFHPQREFGFKVFAGIFGGAFVGVGRIGKFVRVADEFLAADFDGRDVKAVLHPLIPQDGFAQIVRLHDVVQTFQSLQAVGTCNQLLVFLKNYSIKLPGMTRTKW